MEKDRKLIVNADDFGMSRGISEGIIEAHERGIVTSTSIMVTMHASAYAAKLARNVRRLSVGLHGVFTPEVQEDGQSVALYAAQLEHQLTHFFRWFGKPPTHFDLHGAQPATPRMIVAAFAVSKKHSLPFRAQEKRLIRGFYGMKGESLLPDAVSPASLVMLLSDVLPGVSLLVCHPGRTTNRLSDPYRAARRIELSTLTSPVVWGVINDAKIRLINYHDLYR